MNCPICGKPYESMKRNKFGVAEYHHAGDPLNVFCQQSSASYEAVEHRVQSDECPNCKGTGKIYGEFDFIYCLECGGTGIRR